MEIFQEIGRRTRERWKAAGFDEACFADIATEILAETCPCTHVGAVDVLQHYLRLESPPPQPRSDFGQPPVIVYRDRRFYIEVLFWMESTTALHQHAFSGAFHVLAGSSVQSLYRFRPRSRVTSRLWLGDVDLVEVELLRRGSTRPIRAGRQMIHSLFHLEQPSATVVLRTPAESDQRPQFDYRRPYVAYDSLELPDDLERAIAVLNLLARIDPAAAETAVRQFLLDRDLVAVFFVLDMLAFEHPTLFDRVCRDTAEVEARHGSRFREVLESCRGQQWQAQVIDARVEVTHPDHRYLLALLLNVPERDHILRLVQEWSGREPVAMVLEWLQDMATVDEDGVMELPGFKMAPPPQLGRRLHVAVYTIVRALLENQPVLERLAEKFPALPAEAFDEVQARLLTSCLRPLLSQPTLGPGRATLQPVLS